MDTKSADCLICASPLVDGINAKKNWKIPKLLRWAEIRDLKIDETILTMHLQNHINGNGTGPAKTQTINNRIAPETITESKSISHPVVSTDERLLNLIICQIYDGVKENQIDLKVEHAFKAIEIRQKLAESGNVENLLLELLTEIRNQELSK